MPAVPSENFLASKAGPLPVWGWGAVGLGVAYGYSRYKANKAAKTNATTDQAGTAGQFTYGAGQPVSGQPTYLIENNIPGYGDTVASTPVTTPATPTPPVVTPPTTTPQPPVAVPPPAAPPPVQHPAPPPPPAPASAPPSHPSAPPPPRPTPRPPVPTHNAITYRVRPGDNLSKIAAMYHVPGGWQALYAYNTNPQYNAAWATFKRQGPNLLYSGQTIHVPQ